MRSCGKGSYGRLGLGDSNNQTSLKQITFTPEHVIRKVSSSKGKHWFSPTVIGLNAMEWFFFVKTLPNWSPNTKIFLLV